MSEQAPGTHERGVAVIDVSEVKTEPLGEALPEAVVEQPQPTIFEHAYWDQEGERVDREVEAILDRPRNSSGIELECERPTGKEGFERAQGRATLLAPG